MAALAATAAAAGAVPDPAFGRAEPGTNGSYGAVAASYRNPVFTDSGREVPDPAVIRGRDGYWYAYATGDNIRIARSRDLVNWERTGSVFSAGTRPSWAPTGGLWAPDVAYFDGRYYLTFTVADSPLVGPTPNRSIGVATAPTPTGPWTDSGAPLVTPEWWYPTPNSPSQFRSIMDTDLVATPDGRRILYYGGFKGGVYAVDLSADGLRVAGESVKITSEFAYEGAYVVHRDGWYYLFGSSGACCAGPVSGYTVLVGRSRGPFGPFLDRAGQPMLGATPGGTPVIAPTGNTWVGTGHNSIATDAAGQDWMVYHAIDRDNPSNTANPYTGNKRPMLIDRLDWIDGWPVVRGGAGASVGDEPAPAGATVLNDQFEDGRTPGPQWIPSDGWLIGHEPSGGYLRSGVQEGDQVLRAERAVAGDVRVRGALRLPENGDAGAVGLVLADHDDGGGIRVSVDRAADALVVEVRRAGVEPVRVVQDLPAGFRHDSWHELSVVIRGRVLSASVSDAGLYDPVATATATLPAGLAGGEFGLLARDAVADFDDVTVAPLYRPWTERMPDPQLGEVAAEFSDDFSGSSIDPAWRWVRTPAATVRDGRLDFPVQPGDLNGDGNDASVLLRDPPQGTWTVETKVTLPFGDGQPDRYPQAGLVVYLDDDNFLRFTHRAHGAVRSTAFSKEMVFDGRRGAGGVDIVAPPTDVTWLRLRHSIDEVGGDHVYQAATSRDGENWVWGTAYTLPAGTSPQVGLVSHGGEGGHVAQFDYLRFLRP